MNIEIGAKIKQLRIARGMTQEQLGNELSVSAQAVSKWESGTTMPDIQLLPEISVLFGVSIDELFSMTDESRIERIENMIESSHFISKKDFEDSERLLKELMLDESKKLSELALPLKLYPQVLINVRVKDKNAVMHDSCVISAVNKVTETLGNSGRILVRESGTEPLIRVMVEAPAAKLCLSLAERVVKVIENTSRALY